MIQIGDAITAGNETGAYGRLGLLVRDAGGSLLALTSRELIQCGETVSLLTGAASRPIGTRRNPFHPFTGDAAAAANLAGWFCPEIEVPEKLGAWSASRVLDVDEMLGRSVTVICGSGDRAAGIVVRTRWFADISAGSGQAAKPYEGLVRVSMSEGSQAETQQGVSGALVSTNENELVGIVVGRCDADLVVVPLASVLRSEDLTVATDADIRSHNRSVGGSRPDRFPERPQESFISLISSRLGVSGHEINLPEVVLLAWMDLGWTAATTRSAYEPFEPFGRYFTNLHGDLRNLQTSMVSLAVAELPAYADHEIAADALQIAMLEFFGRHGDHGESMQRSKPPLSRQRGSHAYVLA